MCRLTAGAQYRKARSVQCCMTNGVVQPEVITQYNTYHLEERDEAVNNVIKVELGIHPSVAVGMVETCCLVRHYTGLDAVPIVVDAFVKLTGKQLDTQYTEYQPKQQ